MSTAVLSRPGGSIGSRSGGAAASALPGNVIAFPEGRVFRTNAPGLRAASPAESGSPAFAARSIVTAARTAPPAPARVPGSGKLRLTRRGRIVFTLLAALPVVIGVVAIGLNAGGAVASSTVVETNFEYATIGAGETLWQLAVSLAPNADPRDVIAEIKSLNGLNSSAVQAGQRLAIPLRYTAQ